MPHPSVLILPPTPLIFASDFDYLNPTRRPPPYLTVRWFNNTYFWFKPVIHLRDVMRQLNLSFFMPVIAVVRF